MVKISFLKHNKALLSILLLPLFVQCRQAGVEEPLGYYFEEYNNSHVGYCFYYNNNVHAGHDFLRYRDVGIYNLQRIDTCALVDSLSTLFLRNDDPRIHRFHREYKAPDTVQMTVFLASRYSPGYHIFYTPSICTLDVYSPYHSTWVGKYLFIPTPHEQALVSFAAARLTQHGFKQTYPISHIYDHSCFDLSCCHLTLRSDGQYRELFTDIISDSIPKPLHLLMAAFDALVYDHCNESCRIRNTPDSTAMVRFNELYMRYIRIDLPLFPDTSEQRLVTSQ